eukprot:TRINITY_DN10677_c0_g1_i1.p1 TRINITY_DN10677_c0_g1~~TRINITY_DN10677_c0_g1_i1.p1  ORF type:complete len:384 (-),score=67.91 TRINITY_DN10677_c0_g1_i1:237-1388(-)
MPYSTLTEVPEGVWECPVCEADEDFLDEDTESDSDTEAPPKKRRKTPQNRSFNGAVNRKVPALKDRIRFAAEARRTKDVPHHPQKSLPANMYNLVLKALEATEVPHSQRKNVTKSGEKVRGMCFGLTMNYASGLVSSKATLERPELCALLISYMRKKDPDFEFTCIQVNKNYASVVHVDSNNLGPSYIIGLGNYTGGQLWVSQQGELDIKDHWRQFDGNVPHGTREYKGTRYSLIFFTQKSFKGARPDDRKYLESLGFPFPPSTTEMQAYPTKEERLRKGRREWTEYLKKSLAAEPSEAQQQAATGIPAGNSAAGLGPLGIETGSLVRISTLVSRKDLNGRQGEVMEFHVGMGRYAVRVKNAKGVFETIGLKPSALEPVCDLD